MELHKLLFPDLVGNWGRINFGREAASVFGDPNPLLDPVACGKWKGDIHRKFGVEHSYGGYMEDRGYLWRGHYMAPGAAWHYGIDFTVPVCSPVHLPFDGILCNAVKDPDQNGGWGGKVVFKVGGVSVILGHIDFVGLRTPGDAYSKGTFVGVVSPTGSNGGWDPHLHVQCTSLNLNPEIVDGYGFLYEGVEDDFPDPEKRGW